VAASLRAVYKVRRMSCNDWMVNQLSLSPENYHGYPEE
jgi:hypothetical protein